MEQVKSLEQVPAAFTQLFEMVGGLHALVKSIPQAQPQKDLLTVDEAADFLSLKKCTLYDMSSKCEIPHFKQRNRLYFSRAALTSWVHSGEVKTKATLQSEAADTVRTQKRGQK